MQKTNNLHLKKKIHYLNQAWVYAHAETGERLVKTKDDNDNPISY